MSCIDVGSNRVLANPRVAGSTDQRQEEPIIRSCQECDQDLKLPYTPVHYRVLVCDRCDVCDKEDHILKPVQGSCTADPNIVSLNSL